MGPMTGRKMGRCLTGNSQNQAYGQGYGYGAGYGRGRGCGRGFGPRGRGFAPWSMPADTQTPPTKDDLSLRTKALEQELEAIRNELKNYSDE